MAAISQSFGAGGANLTPDGGAGTPTLAGALRDVADDLAMLRTAVNVLDIAATVAASALASPLITTADSAVTAEADAVVTVLVDATDDATVWALANDLKAKYNAAVTLINDEKAKYNAAVTLINELKSDLNVATTLINQVRAAIVELGTDVNATTPVGALLTTKV